MPPPPSPSRTPLLLEQETEDTGSEEGVLKYVIAFDVLHGLALSLLVAVFLTALISARIRRLETWYSFILSFIVLSASNLLLLTRQLGPHPSLQLCTAQAVLIYAAPVWTAASGVAFLLQVSSSYIIIMLTESSDENFHFQIFMHAYYYLKNCSSRLLGGFLYHLIPFLLYLGAVAETTVLSLKHPDLIVRERDGLYCHSRLSIISKISGGIAGFGTVLILIFGLTTAVLLYRSWNDFKKLKKRTGGGISVTLLIRIGLFTFVSVVALGISSSKFVKASYDEAPVYLATAAVPLCAALTIGLQGDILRRWMFWKRYEDPPPTFAMEESSRVSRTTGIRSNVYRTELASDYDLTMVPPTPTSPPSSHLKQERPFYSDPEMEYIYPGPVTPKSSTYPRDSMHSMHSQMEGSPRDSVLSYVTGPSTRNFGLAL
ncbi:hypothetical protein DL96DRAFT_263517 [Flagelloscypha sp. PMI_526]|nr:hypothetical protein DL96DRAFT_263517 [Flagelloscypha sp. PMI_526]